MPEDLLESRDLRFSSQCHSCRTGTCTSGVFGRVAVSYLHRGNSRVYWELSARMIDSEPYEFQLQYSGFITPQDSDWDDVGDPTSDYVAIDSKARSYGKVNRSFYRVKMTTGDGVYYSHPVGVRGTLDTRYARLARVQLRKEVLNAKHNPGGQRGYLLKRRVTGKDCTLCTDYLTGETRDPDCKECRGTGKQCGYYYPLDCVWAIIEPASYHADLDEGKARGTVMDVSSKARMINTYLLGEGDVWVNAVSDDRYYIHQVQDIIEMRGTPLVANAELRKAAYSDPVYGIEIPRKIEEMVGVGAYGEGYGGDYL